jgi:hypothetical protein
LALALASAERARALVTLQLRAQCFFVFVIDRILKDLVLSKQGQSFDT